MSPFATFRHICKCNEQMIAQACYIIYGLQCQPEDDEVIIPELSFWKQAWIQFFDQCDPIDPRTQFPNSRDIFAKNWSSLCV